MKKKILIVNVNWLGDAVFSTPFIRAVRQNYPGAYIACMAAPRCIEALEGNPNLNDIIAFDERQGHKGFRAKLELVKSLKKKGFDTVFLLHRSFTRAFLVYMAGIPERIGYHTRKRSFLLTKKPKAPDGIVHRADYYLGLACAAGLKIDGAGCDFSVTEEGIKWAESFYEKIGCGGGKKTVAINPGGNWAPKRWPAERFAETAGLLYGHFKEDINVIITGSKKDVPPAEKICRLNGNRPVSLCGRTNLKQLAAVFQKADLVVSADSGPLHIAVAAGAKTIGIYGPTSVEVTGPYKPVNKAVILHKEVGCGIPCYDSGCAEFKCMNAITPQEVFDAAKKILLSPDD